MSNQTDFVKTLSEIVQIPSFSKEEKDLAKFLYGFCIKHKFPVEKQDENIVIKFLTGSKKCLIFDAHMDTVKPGNFKLWKYLPYGAKSGVIKNGKIYGLGTSDNKSGIVSLLSLAFEFIKVKPPIDLFIIFSTNEEIDSQGAKSFIKYFNKKYKAKYNEIAAVVVEPTDLEYIELGYRSTAIIEIITSGDSGHGARPEEVKQNAINNMIKVINKINDLEIKLKSEAHDEVLGYPTLTLTGIKSLEGSYNQIPSQCSSIWDIRVTPKIEKKLLSILEITLGKNVKINMIKSPGGCIKVNPKEKIIKIFQQVMSGVKVQSAKGANNTGCFVRSGIPAITFGPGHKAVIHKENEYVEVKNINKAVEIYKQIINYF